MKPSEFLTIEHRTQKLFQHEFSSKVKRLPKIKIQPITGDSTTECYQVDERKCYIQSKEDVFSFTSFSTYGWFRGKKTGDPICDQIIVKYYPNCAICIMADGCGWGEKSLKAATKATEGCLNCINRSIHLCETIKDLGSLLVIACQQAHLNIIQHERNIMKVGTTTLNITCIVKTEKGYYLLVINIGDCRTFHYSKNEHHTLPVCGKFHHTIASMQDSQGRIGAAHSYDPELKKPQLKLI